MTKVLVLRLLAALAFALAVAGPEVAMTFNPTQAMADGSCSTMQPIFGPVLTPRTQGMSGHPRSC